MDRVWPNVPVSLRRKSEVTHLPVGSLAPFLSSTPEQAVHWAKPPWLALGGIPNCQSLTPGSGKVTDLSNDL